MESLSTVFKWLLNQQRLYFFMLNVIGWNLWTWCFGCLLFVLQLKDFTAFSWTLMEIYQTLSSLTPRIYLFQFMIISLLAVQFTIWICNFRAELLDLQSGNCTCPLVSTLVILWCMLASLLLSIICRQGMFLHSIMSFLMIPFLLFHAWKRGPFHQIGMRCAKLQSWQLMKLLI